MGEMPSPTLNPQLQDLCGHKSGEHQGHWTGGVCFFSVAIDWEYHVPATRHRTLETKWNCPLISSSISKQSNAAVSNKGGKLVIQFLFKKKKSTVIFSKARIEKVTGTKKALGLASIQAEKYNKGVA